MRGVNDTKRVLRAPTRADFFNHLDHVEGLTKKARQAINSLWDRCPDLKPPHAGMSEDGDYEMAWRGGKIWLLVNVFPCGRIEWQEQDETCVLAVLRSRSLSGTLIAGRAGMPHKSLFLLMFGYLLGSLVTLGLMAASLDDVIQTKRRHGYCDAECVRQGFKEAELSGQECVCVD